MRGAECSRPCACGSHRPPLALPPSSRRVPEQLCLRGPHVLLTAAGPTLPLARRSPHLLLAQVHSLGRGQNDTLLPSQLPAGRQEPSMAALVSPSGPL